MNSIKSLLQIVVLMMVIATIGYLVWHFTRNKDPDVVYIEGEVDSSYVKTLEGSVDSLQKALVVKPTVEYRTIYRDTVIIDTVEVVKILDQTISAQDSLQFVHMNDDMHFVCALYPRIALQIWQDSTGNVYHQEKFSVDVRHISYKIWPRVQITEKKDKIQLYLTAYAGLKLTERLIVDQITQDVSFKAGIGAQVIVNEKYMLGFILSKDEYLLNAGIKLLDW